MNINYDKTTSIVVLNDSLCQCLTKKGNQNDNIMAYYIKNKLIENGFNNVIGIDCGSLSLNKQHNIYEFLKNNLSLAEIKATQIMSINSARKDLITKIGIPKWQESYYKILPEDYDIFISDSIKYSKNSGIVLSCISNNLMAEVWVNPISYAISSLPFTDSNSAKRFKILLENEVLRNNVIDGIKKNIEYILGINSKAKICLLGIYRPNILPKEYNFLIEEINSKVKNTSEEYNQNYIDINDIKSKLLDFHPNLDNFKLISNKISDNLISRFQTEERNVEVSEINFENNGIDGAINDLNNYYEIEKINVKNTINYLISKGYEKNIIDEVMTNYIIGRPNEILTHIDIYKKAKTLLNKLS